MTTIRYNPDKAGTVEFGHSSVHDYEDATKAVETCYNEFGCCGVAILAIVAVGAVILAGAASQSSDHCWEICSYNDLGVGVCECLFGGK